MSDVVIRCPNCGTTQGALGECEACHESHTRYFCPNHTPGRWLDGPACAACGARFTGRADAETPPAPRPPPSPAARASYTPRERAAPPPRRAPPPEPEVVEADWVEREEPAPWPPVRGRGPGESGRPPTLPFPAVRVDVGSVLGCLARLALLAVALVVVVLLWFFGYCGTSIGFAATPTGASAGVTTEVPPAASAHGSVSLHVDATPTS